MVPNPRPAPAELPASPSAQVLRFVGPAPSHGLASMRNPMRLFEWVAAMSLLAVSLLLTAWPGRASIGGLLLADALRAPVGWFAAILLWASCARAAGLWQNGHWPKYGPILRAGGAFFGAFAWGWIGSALVLHALVAGDVPVGIVMCGGWVAGELVSMYRAIADVRPPQRVP